jgi:hypothetical protein
MKMFARILLTSAMLVGSTSAMAACPVGEYVAAGWNPGTDMEGPANYRAAVEISDRGANVCTIEWDLGGQHFAAVGFFDPSTNELNASYANIEAGWFGIISYRLANGRLDGEWAIYNSGTNQRGREILTRR